MKKAIHTEIEIAASPEKVWGILSDFDSFGSWNPFISKVDGKLGEDEKIKIDVELKGSRTLKLNAIISKVVPNKELVWGGGLPFGLFTGEHFYRIEKLGEDTVRFIHGENFTGLLVRFIWGAKGKQIGAAYVALNEALKKRAEEKERIYRPLQNLHFCFQGCFF